MAFGSVLGDEQDCSSARKERGAFFTPPELADSLASWAICSADDMVLEPACGEAQFLLSSLRRMCVLGASKHDASAHVLACELHVESSQAARLRCAAEGFEPEISTGDFFHLRPDARFDVVIGNPPYIRFQLIDGKQRESMREVTHASGLGLSALSSAWAPFVIHASSFLKEGGRLAFVLPAELLTVNYAAGIRKFLLSSFAEISLVTFDEQVFPEVQEEVVLLLAGGYHLGCADHISWRQCEGLADIGTAQSSWFSPSTPGARWSNGLVSPEVNQCLAEAEGAGFAFLSSWGAVGLGAVTGNNGFFALSAEAAGVWELGSEDVVRLCPPGSRHLRKLSLSDDDMKALEAAGKQTMLFHPDSEPSAAALRYIQHGCALGVDGGYKCRKRSPWWRVPVADPPDAFLTYMNDFTFNVCSNDAQVHCLNSVHGITFSPEKRELGMELLPLACLNSITLLSAEIEGRAYGGGILKLEPREASRLLVPSYELVSGLSSEFRIIREKASALLAQGDVLAASALSDTILVDAGVVSTRAVEQTRAAKERLFTRRRARGKKKR